MDLPQDTHNSPDGRDTSRDTITAWMELHDAEVIAEEAITVEPGRTPWSAQLAAYASAVTMTTEAR